MRRRMTWWVIWWLCFWVLGLSPGLAAIVVLVGWFIVWAVTRPIPELEEAKQQAPWGKQAEAAQRERRYLSADQRLQVFQRDGERCVVCGSGHDLSVDHIIPVSRGGNDTTANLQTLCGSCNSRKGASLEMPAMEGAIR